MSEPAPSSPPDLAGQDWDTLVSVKRRLSSELKGLTDAINEIDSRELGEIASKIRGAKSQLGQIGDQLKETQLAINKKNSELLSLSEKMSQSKNFLSLMVERLPSESEEELSSFVSASQPIIDSGGFKSQKEKEETLSKIRDATMKLEAIKATRMVREQFTVAQTSSAEITASLKELGQKLDSLNSNAATISEQLDKLYDSKRALYSAREKHVSAYDEKLGEFERVNERLDAMSAMRKKQRNEYGADFPSDALFKVKENAKKKLESGSKLTFEELKLLYSDMD